MDLAEYRASASEQQRTANLVEHIPPTGETVLDIGARDGHFSRLLADRFQKVIAFDLEELKISHPRVQCVIGNAANLTFPDRSFDFVFCAEVLEHIPMPDLKKVCSEIERVARSRILIGVPYKQDIRVGRTTCYTCRRPNPPWGHVNKFDEQSLQQLFPHCELESISFVGETKAQTNWMSVVLMDFAGNPYGSYDQEEPCIYCGNRLVPPAERSIAQRGATKLALWLRALGNLFVRPRKNWIHVVLQRNGPCAPDVEGRRAGNPR